MHHEQRPWRQLRHYTNAESRTESATHTFSFLFKHVIPAVVIILAGLFALSLPAAIAEPWPIKSFQVVAVEPAAQVDPSELEIPLAPEIVSAAAQRASNSYGGLLADLMRFARNDSLDIDLPESSLFAVIEPSPELDNLIAEIEQTLAQSAQIMENEGFLSPALEPIITKADGTQAYRVYLVKGLTGAAGEYHPDLCESRFHERVIRLDFVKLQEFDENGRPTGRLSIGGTQTVAHELFHAVQSGSPFFQNCERPLIGSWITEGTARTAGVAIAGKLRPGELTTYLRDDIWYKHREMVWGARNYSRPLYIPHESSAVKPPRVAYHTSSFWSYLAEYQATNGHPRTPGRNPQSIGYLAHLFYATASERDCNTPGADCKAEIAWLDSQLRVVFGKPLRDLYAKFAQAYALYGYHRLSGSPLWDPEWLERSFNDCPEVVLGPQGDDRQFVVNVRQLNPLSMSCFKVSPQGFQAAGVLVAITAEMTTHAERPTLNQLTAVVADGTERLSRATATQITGQRQRATWEYEFPVLTEYAEDAEDIEVDDVISTIFLLTNVADDAEFTAPFLRRDDSRFDDTNFTLTFTVIDDYAAMSIDGVESDGDESYNYDVSGEFDDTLKSKSFGLFYDPPHARGTCFVNLELSSEQHDYLQIVGIVTAPLRPGRYPIEPSGPEARPDILDAGLLWNSRSDLGGGNYNRFHTRRGTLDIISVSPSAITGNFAISLGKFDDLVDVTGKFGLPPRLPGAGNFFGRFGSDHPCLAFPEPNPAAGQPGAGGTPSGEPGSNGPDFDDPGSDDPTATAPPPGHDDNRSGAGATDRGNDGESVAGGAGTDNGIRPGADTTTGGAENIRNRKNLEQTEIKLDFVEGENAAIRSAAQVVHLAQDGAAVTSLSSTSFNLTLALPQRELYECGSRLTEPWGFIEIMSMIRGERGRKQVRLVSDLEGTTLQLDASSGEVTLKLGMARGTITLRGSAPAVKSLSPGASGSVRVEVKGASLEAIINQHSLVCDKLLDFSFLVTTVH